ncbi:MAG: hypothetical protein HQL69_02555 [Magnetococcales bacterium]|nr:hypothetical protein [Magnetococcales bacterium]
MLRNIMIFGIGFLIGLISHNTLIDKSHATTPIVNKTVVYGIDLSDDALVVKAKSTWLKRLGKYLAKDIKVQPYFTRVVATTFGDFDFSNDHIIVPEITITARKRATKPAKQIYKFMRQLPTKFGDEDIVPEKETRILDYIRNQASIYGCKNTTILVVTDGVHFAAGGSNILEMTSRSNSYFPAMKQELDGCGVHMVGFGMGQRPIIVREMTRIWSDWAKRSGVQLQIIRAIN